jgi:transglutaminase/protease-like cytokinesis protein 3
MEEGEVGREPSKERTEKLDLKASLEAEIDQLNKEIAVYQTKDPELVDKKKADAKECKRGANIWTDNIESMESYIKKTLMKSTAEIRKAFEIPEDLESL